MNMDIEVLKEITATAVKAAGMRDYELSPLKRLHVRPDGTQIGIDFDPPKQINALLDLPGVVKIVERYKGEAEVFVGEECITVLHDKTRTKGYSHCELVKSEPVNIILQNQNKPLSPEIFERLACHYFGVDDSFISRLRKLQWKTQAESTARITNINKSMDAHEISRVIDENDDLFQDVSLFVNTPYFVLPYETEEFEVELQIVANAEHKTISFAPVPGTMEKVLLQVLQEIQSKLTEMLGKTYTGNILLGEPENL
jgi:hypothetical protein